MIEFRRDSKDILGFWAQGVNFHFFNHGNPNAEQTKWWEAGCMHLTVHALCSLLLSGSDVSSSDMALHEVTRCMVVWCTQNLRRDGSSFMWYQPCQRCKYTTSVDLQKRAIE